MLIPMPAPDCWPGHRFVMALGSNVMVPRVCGLISGCSAASAAAVGPKAQGRFRGRARGRGQGGDALFCGASGFMQPSPAAPVREAAPLQGQDTPSILPTTAACWHDYEGSRAAAPATQWHMTLPQGSHAQQSCAMRNSTWPMHFGSSYRTAKSCCDGMFTPCEEVDAACPAWPKAGLSCAGAAGTNF